ncbi:hypothetical protein NC652_034702 [Populus alba x Populus x berolinensis]|uniref:Uncharacterized protein n=1 Tax=Populus alba x Populus x berolinensis TaxID=444605 RepID=A0AAD6LMY7_9ROSI|nr:hypothetical protein NC652_034702 [Populus alba x Populus x berolinensis]KAJ6970106.1 hypothetical protein NC653_034627 [Populus alba x Populus x berolinensis]
MLPPVTSHSIVNSNSKATVSNLATTSISPLHRELQSLHQHH